MNTLPFLQQGWNWLEQSGLKHSLPARIAVGWSGGADSTALLLALANSGYEVHAWHIDHAWHDRSDAEAEALQELAVGWSIPFTSVRLPLPTGRNRESEARSGRYRAFGQLSELHGIEALCLAHHRDDQAETVCMRMLQGAGARGVSGMRPVSKHGELVIYRPLLHVAGSELRLAVMDAGVEWLEDASNRDVTLWRNRLRHHYFPALKRFGVDPIELHMRWQNQAEKVAGRLDAGVSDIELDADSRSCSTEWMLWQKLSPELRATLLQRMMRQLFGQAAVAGRRHIELVEAWMEQGGRGGIDLSRSRLMRKGGRLLLMKQLS